jgi:hypothetical protein
LELRNHPIRLDTACLLGFRRVADNFIEKIPVNTRFFAHLSRKSAVFRQRISMKTSGLPRGLGDTWKLALVSHVTETDTRYTELA